MQSTTRKSHRHVALGVKEEASVSSLLSASCLSFYNDPPTRECTLPEFEQSAFDRLQVLKAIDNARAKRSIARAGGGGGTTPQEGEDFIKALLQRHKLWQDSERDRLSHHVLRLAYCRSEETRRWLIASECALFKWRFETEPKAEVVAAFLKEHELNYQPVAVQPHYRAFRSTTPATASAHPLLLSALCSADD